MHGPEWQPRLFKEASSAIHTHTCQSCSCSTCTEEMRGLVSVAALFLLAILPAPLCSAAHADLSKYPFHRTLFDAQGQYYSLYWNYSIAAKTIHFAVNVSTRGWVGFGVSPNGQMPNSDVVIGWVAENNAVYFHVSIQSFYHKALGMQRSCMLKSQAIDSII